MLTLVKPDIRYKNSFEDYIQAFGGIETIHGIGYGEKYTGIDDYLTHRNNTSAGINLAEGRVPASTFWLLEDSIMVGTIDIRHELNDFLLKEGGHIGYSIHPDYHGQGYGKEILRLGLQETQKLGIEKVLVVCRHDNIASEKVILANGGILENVIEGNKRYWIENN